MVPLALASVCIYNAYACLLRGTDPHTLTSCLSVSPSIASRSSSLMPSLNSISSTPPPLNARTFSCERRGEQSAEAGKVLLPVVVVVVVVEGGVGKGECMCV